MIRCFQLPCWVGFVAFLAATSQDVSGNSTGLTISADVLSEAASFPWYDPETDSIRVIELTESAELPRSPNWVAEPRPKKTVTPPTKRAPRRPWSPQLEAFLQFLSWFLLAVLIGVGLYFWIRSVTLPALNESHHQDSALMRTEAERIERLPFQFKRPTQDLLAEARHHYTEGNYSEAIIYLYSYQLIQLDRHQLITLEKANTNRQYLLQLVQHPWLRQQLTRTMLAFEDVFFGHYTLSSERFESCWNDLDRFRQTIREVRSAKGVAT